MIKRIAVLFMLLALLTACSPLIPVRPASLTVFAAASLTEAFTDIGRAFETSHPGVSVVFNFSGSQALSTQLEQGAVADVFASADQQQMDRLVADKLVNANDAQVFTTNKLVVILPAGNPAGIHTLDGLKKPGLKIVLAAEEVPAGRYARRILENLNDLYGSDFMNLVLANVVSNEDNIRQVVAKVQLGEADAGIAYLSDLLVAPLLQTIQIPDEFNVIATYPIAALMNAPNPELAHAFVNFVLSPEGRDILNKRGFVPVTP